MTSPLHWGRPLAPETDPLAQWHLFKYTGFDPHRHQHLYVSVCNTLVLHKRSKLSTSTQIPGEPRCRKCTKLGALAADPLRDKKCDFHGRKACASCRCVKCGRGYMLEYSIGWFCSMYADLKTPCDHQEGEWIVKNFVVAYSQISGELTVVKVKARDAVAAIKSRVLEVNKEHQEGFNFTGTTTVEEIKQYMFDTDEAVDVLEL